MTRDLSARKLAGRRLMVATPMYEGMCHAVYVRGLVELALRCREKGISLTLNLITNQPDVNRARAYIANAFLRGDSDHLMMIDADVGFRADDVLALLRAQLQDPACGVIGATYARKHIDWPRVANAARAEADVALPAIASPLTVNLATTGAPLRLDRPQQVNELATGFLMVTREVLERVADRFPELSFRPSPSERQAFGIGPTATSFFATTIDAEGGYLSGDFAFSRRVREVGLGVWLCPWITLTHVGNMTFAGSLPEIAKLATVLQSQ